MELSQQPFRQKLAIHQQCFFFCVHGNTISHVFYCPFVTSTSYVLIRCYDHTICRCVKNVTHSRRRRRRRRDDKAFKLFWWQNISWKNKNGKKGEQDIKYLYTVYYTTFEEPNRVLRQHATSTGSKWQNNGLEFLSHSANLVLQHGAQIIWSENLNCISKIALHHERKASGIP